MIATGFNSPSEIGQPIEEISTVSLESQSHADAISSDVLEPTMQENSVANTVGQTMWVNDVIESMLNCWFGDQVDLRIYL